MRSPPSADEPILFSQFAVHHPCSVAGREGEGVSDYRERKMQFLLVYFNLLTNNYF